MASILISDLYGVIVTEDEISQGKNTLNDWTNQYQSKSFYFDHCPRKVDTSRCPTIFCLGQTFVIPSKIIICRSALRVFYIFLGFMDVLDDLEDITLDTPDAPEVRCSIIFIAIDK